MQRVYSSLSGGELFERITAEGYTMSEAEVINYMRQICEGVKHMHERNIIHLGNIATELWLFCLPYFYLIVSRHQAGERDVHDLQEHQRQDH